MTTGAGYAGELAAEARVQLGRVEAAWRWLCDARVRGTTHPAVSRPVDPRAAARMVEVWRLDRAAAVQAALAGRKTGAVPAPGDLHVVTVRAGVAAQMTALTLRMWAATGNDERPGRLILLAPADGPPVGPPGSWATEPRRRLVPCGWCDRGTLVKPEQWPGEWPTDPMPCPRCHGRGELRSGRHCPACGAGGPCGCDRADLTVALAARTVDELLDAGDVEAVADAEYTLYGLAELAERTVGLGPDRRRLPGAECPVCGTRELVPEVGNPDPRKWAIYCQGPDCRCQGPGCPCGIGTGRRRDRRHMWPSCTWDGPRGLAAVLGVDLPGTRQPGHRLSA